MTARSSARRLAPVLILALGLIGATAASAQAPKDLSQVGLEDLMRLEVQRVFGASERLQPVTEAPASVTIVTAAEITRYGYRTLADILRAARGFYVSNDRNYSYVGVRGFAQPGDYNTRVLLLLNGHRLNDDVYDQAAIGADFGVDVAMFERVEIIRGPSSSLYGSSAFFAVVNVITRSGASIDGVSVDLDGGTLQTGLARVSAGRALANGVDVAVSGTFERSGGDPRLYFPAFDTAATNHGVAEHLDGERVADVYARVAAGNFAITLAFGRRQKDVPTASFDTLFNEQTPAEQTTDRHTTIAAQYGRTLGGTQLAFDAGFDRYDYDGVYPYASDNPAYPVLVNTDGARGLRWNAGVRATRRLRGRQTLTAGAAVYHNVRQDQFYRYNDPAIAGLTLPASSYRTGAYIQDEIRVRPWLLLNGGVRYDRYEEFARATPRAAVIASPSASTSFKYLYGEAFRAPNAYELSYYGPAPGLRPEFVRTHEVAWERYTREWLRTSVSAYHYLASQLITLQSNLVDGVTQLAFANDGVITANGLEFEVEARSKKGVQALASYALQRARPEGDDTSITNSPQHLAKARVSVPLAVRGFASVQWQFVGRRGTLAGSSVGASSVIDLTAGWPVAPSLFLIGSIRNLLDDEHADPGSDEHRSDSIEQTGRTLRIGLRWTLGGPQ